MVRGQPAFFETLEKRLALEQLHHEVVDAVLLADVVEHAEVGMVETGNGSRPALETRSTLGVLREFGRQHLDRDVATEPRVLRAVDLAHAPGADRGHDFVGAKANAGSEGHGFGGLFVVDPAVYRPGNLDPLPGRSPEAAAPATGLPPERA
jgi:hypothetical protein